MTTEEIEIAVKEYTESLKSIALENLSGEEIPYLLRGAFKEGLESANKHWQEKQKANIENLFSDQNFINNLCFSFRHDYGLLDSNERDIIKFECSEWLRAIINNWKEIE
ncbi:MAG: hypothetical protein RBT65_16065 [Methanolobus sp.]|nr:hypothetical protein [Methanolobus sp.]